MADLIKQTQEELVYLTSPQLGSFPGLRHAFFTRRGGVSQGIYESLNFGFGREDPHDQVLKNYAIATAHLGSKAADVAHTSQQHTDHIAVVDYTDGVETPLGEEGVDALITNRTGICLTGFYADCQLILIFDHKKRVCAVVHAGWRGVVNQIVLKTIEKMNRQFSCRPADMTVAVGPSICRRCFETDEDVPDALFAAHGEQIRDYIYQERGKWHVDLKNITYSMLLRGGILPYNIDMSNTCTCCDNEGLFWSQRNHGDNRGAHAGMIVMETR